MPKKSKKLAPEVKDSASVQDNAENVVAEEVETVEEPKATNIPPEKRDRSRKAKADAKKSASKPQQEPASKPEEKPVVEDTPAPARSYREHEQRMEEHRAARNMRQDDVMIVAKFINAQKRNNVLAGQISAVEVKGNHTFWILYDGPVTIMIPFHEALPFAVEDAKDDIKFQRQLLSKAIGATVQYSVEALERDEENPMTENAFLAYGSRRIAIERIRNRYFGKNAANPVKVGDDVVGTFLAVGPHAAWLNVNGMDVRMVPRQLSHRYMENMMDVYKAGDQVRMRVQKIGYEDGELVLQLSGLPCELEDRMPYLSRVRKGVRCTGIITSHRVTDKVNPVTKRKEPYYYASMWLEGLDLPAFATVTASHAKGTAHSGERVAVEVEDISANGYVKVKIVAYLPQ